MITARKASVRVRVRVIRLGVHVQIRDAAARANAGAWLRPGAHPGGLGEHKARDTLCPKPAACHTPRHIAMPARPHRWNATCQPGGAGRCGTVVMGDRVWWRPSVKGAQELHRLHECIVLRRHPWHTETRSCWGKTSDRRDAQRLWSALLIATRAAASPTGAWTARRRPGRSARAPARAVGMFYVPDGREGQADGHAVGDGGDI